MESRREPRVGFGGADKLGLNLHYRVSAVGAILSAHPVEVAAMSDCPPATFLVAEVHITTSKIHARVHACC